MNLTLYSSIKEILSRGVLPVSSAFVGVRIHHTHKLPLESLLCEPCQCKGSSVFPMAFLVSPHSLKLGDLRKKGREGG